jgi:Domain of Unknown Function (DUF1080)
MKRIIYLLCFFIPVIPVVNSQTPNTLTSKKIKSGWILLFDGTSTKGWTTTQGLPVPAGWVVSDGCLTAIKGGKGGDIITKDQYSNFDFSVDFKIETGCNSGIKYFFTKYEKGGNLGMEYQIIDDINGEDNKQVNHLLGSFYDVLPADESKKKVNAPGNWNTIRILATGKKVEHWLNGVNILTFKRGNKQFTDAVALSKFSKTEPAFGTVDKGHILLQEHGGVVSFRNIKIKLIK